MIAARVWPPLAVAAAFAIPAVALAPRAPERISELPPTVESAVEAAAPAVTACFANAERQEVLIRVSIPADGSVMSVVGVSGAGPTDVEHCVADRLGRARYPRPPEALHLAVLVSWDGTLAMRTRLSERRSIGGSDGLAGVYSAIERCLEAGGDRAFVMRLLVDSDGRAIGARPFDGTDPGPDMRCITTALLAGTYQPSDAIVDRLVTVQRRGGVATVTATERGRDRVTPRNAYFHESATILRWEYQPGAVGSRTPATNP